MFHKLLIPLDGSTLAEHALRPAFSLAERQGAEVLLLRVAFEEKIVIPEIPEAGGARGVAWPEQSLDYSVREARDYLTAIQMAYATPERIVWAKVVTEATSAPDVAATIVATARSEGSDLIVMSSHGRSGLAHWVLGSVAERVLSAAPCPALILRSAVPLKHMLITVDGSQLSEQALEPGLVAAARLGCEVDLLHVVPAIDRRPGTRQPDHLRDKAEAYLQHLIDSHPHTGLTIRPAVEVGAAAERILAYAEAHPVDLIVMATHGHTGLRRWVYGSVANRVLHQARHSMLIVRPVARAAPDSAPRLG